MLWRHPENVELEKVKVVHYCTTGSKPWRYTGKEANKDREDIKMLILGIRFYNFSHKTGSWPSDVWENDKNRFPGIRSY
ncbi:hypothetical protein QQ045_017964 [Rhodiola kirilowii]